MSVCKTNQGGKEGKPKGRCVGQMGGGMWSEKANRQYVLGKIRESTVFSLRGGIFLFQNVTGEIVS